MRYFWKGTISFGLINIPIGLYTASDDHQLKFKLLHEKDLSEIRYARICKDEGKEVPYEQIVKGVERNGRYVVMEPEDFSKASGETSKDIDIIAFCDADAIDPIYFETHYFIKPDKSGTKAYFLLEQALHKTKKIALVRFTLRKRNHIAAIMPYQNILSLVKMRFHHQIIDVDKLAISESVKVTTKEVEMAEKLIAQLSGPFEPQLYHDDYIDSLEEIIAKRASKAKSTKGTKRTKVQEEKIAEVYDIMALLKASLDEKKPRSTKKKKAA